MSRIRQHRPSTRLNKLQRTVGPAEHARIDSVLDSVMAGSNKSDFTTGNESGAVHSGGAPVTRGLGLGKERFVREIPDREWITAMESRGGQRWRRGMNKWRKKLGRSTA